ncbi:MAG: pilin [bacterium]|nr:pilin [bacterium]
MLKKICLITVLFFAFLITARHAKADSNAICDCDGNTSWVTNCSTDNCPDVCSCTYSPNSNISGNGAVAPNISGPGASGAPGQPVQLTNPLTGNATSKDIPTLLGNIIQYAMGIIGSLALVMFIFGGATWMLSAGNQERVTKGKNIIIWAALGLAMIFTAYALVRFLIETLGKSGG